MLFDFVMVFLIGILFGYFSSWRMDILSERAKMQAVKKNNQNQ